MYDLTMPMSPEVAAGKFLNGNWLEEEKTDGMQPVGTPPKYVGKWADHFHALRNSSISADNIMAAANEWISSHVTHIDLSRVTLPASSPTLHFIEAIKLVADGKEDDLNTHHITALSKGKEILARLHSELCTNIQGMHPAIPRLFQGATVMGPKGKAVSFDVNKAIGDVYADMVLPALQPIFNPSQYKRFGCDIGL